MTAGATTVGVMTVGAMTARAMVTVQTMPGSSGSRTSGASSSATVARGDTMLIMTSPTLKPAASASPPGSTLLTTACDGTQRRSAGLCCMGDARCYWTHRRRRVARDAKGFVGHLADELEHESFLEPRLELLPLGHAVRHRQVVQLALVRDLD